MRACITIAGTAGLICLVAAACSGGGPKCSDPETIARVVDYYDKRYKNRPDSRAHPEVVHTFSLIDIITTEETPRRASCKATLSDSVVNTKDPITGLHKYDVTYVAQLQDDGKLVITASSY